MTKLSDDKFSKTERAKPLREQRLADDIELATRALGKFAEAEERLARARPGHPGAASYDGTGAGGGEGGSPIERALGVDGSLIDPTARGRALRDAALRQLQLGAEGLAAYVEAWAPHAPTDAARKLAEAAAEERCLCAHCTKWVAPGNAEDMHRHSDCNGNLPHPMALCRWCYQFVRRAGRLPYKGEVQRHEKGLQVRLPA